MRKIGGVISDKVLKEVFNYYRRFHTKNLADTFRKYLHNNTCKKCNGFYGLPQRTSKKTFNKLVVVKKFGIKYLIAIDRDYMFEEYEHQSNS